MYKTTRDIIGYAIKAKRMLVDENDIEIDALGDMLESDLYVTYYIGTHGRHLLSLPQDPKALFKEKYLAESHIQKYFEDNNKSFAVVIPVYKKLDSNLNVAKKTLPKRQPELLEFRQRTRKNSPTDLVENKKRKLAKKAGLIPKLR